MMLQQGSSGPVTISTTAPSTGKQRDSGFRSLGKDGPTLQ